MPQQSADDALVAKNLSRMLDVPASKLDTFVKNRDETTLQNLRATLRSMPGTDWPSADAGHAGSQFQSKPSTSPSQMRLNRAQSAHSTFGKRHKDAQERMNLLKSSNLVHTEHRNSLRGGGFSPHAFNGGLVHSSFKPQLDEWQASAQQEDLDTFADTCRSVRSACVLYGSTPPSLYGRMCIDTMGAPYKQPKKKKNSRNTSKMPFGSIYVEPSDDPLRSSDHVRMRKVEEALRRTRSGEIHRADFGSLQSIVDPPRCKGVSAHKCFMEMAHPNNTNSASRSGWNADVHSKVNLELKNYGPARPVTMPGEHLWHECSNDIAFSMGIHQWPRVQAGNAEQLANPFGAS